MDLNLTSKTAIITGGSGAIGEAICKGFAAEGATVVIADVNDKKGTLWSGSLMNREGRCMSIPTSPAGNRSRICAIRYWMPSGA